MKITALTASVLAYASIVSAVPTLSPEDAAAPAEASALEPRWYGWWRKRPVRSPFEFDRTYFVKATPDQVIATNQTAVPGQQGACGYYNFGINSYLDTICYNITLVGVTGEYQSPAFTATHIHEAVRGRAGPPRIAFPNPVADSRDPNVRRSAGCLTGPFRTNITANGTDTGTGFRVAQIIASPSSFFADVHTSQFVAGAVRGQLA